MSAGPVSHEIELARTRRIGGRFQRRAARIGDGSRRQAVDHVGVVRRRLLDLAALDRTSESSLAADQSVDDGRIGLQLHLLLQPVGEYGGDARALVWTTRFLLDDRRQRYELFNRANWHV